jgi:hypothetical protein
MSDLRDNAALKTIRTKDRDTITYAEFRASRSKEIIGELDRILAVEYGFTVEELDFVQNFDAKYRLGQDEPEDSEQ